MSRSIESYAYVVVRAVWPAGVGAWTLVTLPAASMVIVVMSFKASVDPGLAVERVKRVSRGVAPAVGGLGDVALRVISHQVGRAVRELDRRHPVLAIV